MAKGKRRGFFKLKGAGNKGRGGLGGGLGVAAACENNGVFALEFKLGGAYVGDGREFAAVMFVKYMTQSKAA